MGVPKLKTSLFPVRRRMVFLVLAIGFLGALAGIRFSSPSISAEQTSSQPVELAGVDVEAVAFADIDRSLIFSGTLQPLHQSTLTAEVEGRMLSVEVRAGDKVAAGQILAQIDARDLQSRLAEQRARLASSQAQFQLAEKTQRRNEELVARKFISPASLDNSSSALDANRENMRAQEALVVLAQQAVDKSVIRAPIAGFVAERAVEPGQAVVPGARLFSVVDLLDLELVANVPVSEVGSIRPGQSIHLQVAGMATAATGTVERIAPTADPATRMIPIYVRVSNPALELKGGMLVQGRLAVATGKAELAVHEDAIRRDGGQAFVLRIKDGMVERVSIETGLRDDATGRVEVRKGLAAEDRVVLAKIRQLVPGQRVVVRQ